MESLGGTPGNSSAMGSSTCEDARVATCILQDWRGGLACSACFGWEMEDTRALGMRRQGQAAPATRRPQLFTVLLIESKSSKSDGSPQEIQ